MSDKLSTENFPERKKLNSMSRSLLHPRSIDLVVKVMRIKKERRKKKGKTVRMKARTN